MGSTEIGDAVTNIPIGLLDPTSNTAEFQSYIPVGKTSGDYFEATNAILIVEGGALMSVDPEPPASGECYDVGEQFDVLINIDPMGTPIRGAQFDLHYDGSVIMVDNFELGGFLLPPVSIDHQSIDNSGGVASFGASMTGGMGGGATTPGTFVIVHCMAVGLGATSTLNLTGVVAYDNQSIPEEVAVNVFVKPVVKCVGV